MKNLIIAIVIIAAFVSCNKEKSQKEEVKEPAKEVVEVEENKFSVELRVRYSKPDELKLFASDIFISNRRTMDIRISEKIKKSKEFNTIKFDLPNDLIPDRETGLLLGSNNENTIYIELLKVSFGDIEYLIQPEELETYVTFNKYIEYNIETGTIKTKKVNGTLNPIIFLRRKILDNLEN